MWGIYLIGSNDLRVGATFKFAGTFFLVDFFSIISRSFQHSWDLVVTLNSRLHDLRPNLADVDRVG